MRNPDRGVGAGGAYAGFDYLVSFNLKNTNDSERRVHLRDPGIDDSGGESLLFKRPAGSQKIVARGAGAKNAKVFSQKQV